MLLGESADNPFDSAEIELMAQFGAAVRSGDNAPFAQRPVVKEFPSQTVRMRPLRHRRCELYFPEQNLVENLSRT